MKRLLVWCARGLIINCVYRSFYWYLWTNLYSCMFAAAGSACCRATDDERCRATCQRLFIADTHRPTKTAISNIMDSCNSAVTSCVLNYTASITWNQLSGLFVCLSFACTHLSTRNRRSSWMKWGQFGERSGRKPTEPNWRTTDSELFGTSR